MKTRLSLFTAALLISLAALGADKKAASPEAEAARADIQKTLGFVPAFLKAVPDHALPGAWEEMKTLELNPASAIPGKYKELMGLAVAAQVPCSYCTYFHTQLAKAQGATDEEIGEAVTISALTRHWSTWLNGLQMDEAIFRAELGKAAENARKMAAAKSPPPPPVQVTDSASALKEIEQSFGFIPQSLKSFPEEGIAGAWKELRDVEFNPNTAIPNKYKLLISLGVAAQVPCRYCVISDTEAARLEGATDKEIREAVAVASIVRHWSTLLNGLQVDEAAFRKDTDRIVKNMKARPGVGGSGRTPSKP